MTKSEMINLLTLLSALEAWTFSGKDYPPDWLLDDLNTQKDLLKKRVMEER